jgi:hypothetical protein
VFGPRVTVSAHGSTPNRASKARFQQIPSIHGGHPSHRSRDTRARLSLRGAMRTLRASGGWRSVVLSYASIVTTSTDQGDDGMNDRRSFFRWRESQTDRFSLSLVDRALRRSMFQLLVPKLCLETQLFRQLCCPDCGGMIGRFELDRFKRSSFFAAVLFQFCGAHLPVGILPHRR